MTKSHECKIYSNYKINLKKGEFKKRWKEQKLEHNKTTTMVEKIINIQFKSTTAFNSNTQTKNDRGAIFLSASRASKVSKKFIMWHSAQNFLFKLLAFEIENTQVMTLSVETVPMIKSQLISNSSERLGSPKA